MARKKLYKSNSSTRPTLEPAQAAQLLRAHRDKGHQLLNNRPISSSSNQAWETVIHDLLIRAFGSESPNIERVMSVGRYEFAFGGGNEISWENARANNMKTRLDILDGLIDLLDSIKPYQPSSIQSEIGNKVFLVHGHDDAILQETARLLERFDLEVIILREQPNSGRTIIEKFVDYSNVAFAVVLLTDDDRGGIKSLSFDNQKFRPRQNVVLELGFFLGKLGRNRVCALYKEDVEIPSDYQGVLYLPIDAMGAWRLSLARELKAAGIDIDLNKAV